jgi:F-type H+-transporting ATPase subunit delta
MSVSKIAYRYGKSLLDLAQDQGVTEAVVADVRLLQEALENRDFQNLVQSPIVKADKKLAVFQGVFGGKVSDLMMKYYEVIIKKGRESFLPVMAQSFIEQYNKLQHTTSVRLTTAQQLSDEVVAEIRAKLEASEATDEKVELEVEVDEDLIGGFVIDLDDRQYDGSVKKKLADLRQEFSKK